MNINIEPTGETQEYNKFLKIEPFEPNNLYKPTNPAKNNGWE